MAPDYEHLLVLVTAWITGEGTTTDSDDMSVTWSCRELSDTSGCVQIQSVTHQDDGIMITLIIK